MLQGAADGAPGLQRLLDELRALEARAGIAAAAERLRANLDAESRDRVLQRQLRELYFGVAFALQRRRLIAKHRELSRFESAWKEADLADATRRSDEIERRPREGWWMAAIVGAALIIVGYELFATAGALAGAVVALFVGSGIEQEARRRHRRAVADARSDLDSAEMRARDSLALFSESEERTGMPDESPEHAL